MEQKINDFVTWLREKHSTEIEAFGISLRPDGHGGLGVYATKTIEAGEMLAEIPISALLTAKAARRALSAKKEFSKVLEMLEGEELLWLYMIWARKEPSSDWYPYLQILPTTDPLLWLRSEKALAWLKGTTLENAAEVLKQQEQRHQQIREELGEVAGSLEDWFWARHCYLSRSFDQVAFPRSEDWGSAAMVPLLDSMNHQPDAQVEAHYGEEMAGLRLPLQAEGPYQPGDEVFHLYKGDADNGTLLLSYGFTLSENPYDFVDSVVFSLQHVRDAMALENAMMAELLPCNKVLVRLQEVLRLNMLEPPVELLRAAALVHGSDYEEETVSSRQKAQVCHWLLKVLRDMLHRTAFQVHPKLMVLVNHKGRLGRFASGVAAQRVKDRQKHSSLAVTVLPSATSLSYAPAQYALNQFLILHKVAVAVKDIADMAILSARMEASKSSKRRKKATNHPLGRLLPKLISTRNQKQK